MITDLTFQCSNNGLSISKLDDEGPQCKTLEMFFSGNNYFVQTDLKKYG